MRVLILGGTGFVGLPLAASLQVQGHSVTLTSRKGTPPLLPRHITPQMARWDGIDPRPLVPLLCASDVIINLVGENIGAGRWNMPRKQRILQSRTQAGEALCLALAEAAGQKHLPGLLIQASATGYYGLWDDAATAPACTEDHPLGQGFLAEVCAAWEASTAAAEGLGLRRCILRLAPVVGRHFSLIDENGTPHGEVGGFVKRMAVPFHYFLGGVPGSGRQPLSWVHMEDVVGAVHLMIRRKELAGVFNIASPYPVPMALFASALGKTLSRPCLVPVPGPLLRLVLGAMAEELILAGQKALPQRLTALGHEFRYPHVTMALQATLH